MKPVAEDAVKGEMSEAEIDQNLADTFPASDPPSWTLGTDHGQESDKKPDKMSNSEVDDGLTE